MESIKSAKGNDIVYLCIQRIQSERERERERDLDAISYNTDFFISGVYRQWRYLSLHA